MEVDDFMIKLNNMETFAQITRPLKKQAKKSDMKESDTNKIIHDFRKSKKIKN